MKIKTILLLLALTYTVTACQSKGPVGNTSVPEPAKSVDPQKYVGRWYEIARYEQGFQKDCEAVTADYTLNKDGTIEVLNTCRQDAVDGRVRTADAIAKIVDTKTNAKLKVSFFRPFYGDYWIMDRADDYTWSIVGEPSGRYLWLLFRSPQPSAKDVAMVKSKAQKMGYDLTLLRDTKQPAR